MCDEALSFLSSEQTSHHSSPLVYVCMYKYPCLLVWMLALILFTIPVHSAAENFFFLPLGKLVWEVKSISASRVWRGGEAESRLTSRLPGLSVLAFLIGNVFVATLVPKVTASCSPEVTLISIHRAASSWSGQRGTSHRERIFGSQILQPAVICCIFSVPDSFWREAQVVVTQQLPPPAVWQVDRSSAE